MYIYIYTHILVHATRPGIDRKVELNYLAYGEDRAYYTILYDTILYYDIIYYTIL